MPQGQLHARCEVARIELKRRVARNQEAQQLQVERAAFEVERRALVGGLGPLAPGVTDRPAQPERSGFALLLVQGQRKLPQVDRALLQIDRKIVFALQPQRRQRFSDRLFGQSGKGALDFRTFV